MPGWTPEPPGQALLGTRADQPHNQAWHAPSGWRLGDWNQEGVGWFCPALRSQPDYYASFSAAS